MNQSDRHPWRILAVVMVIALVSMACSFSLGTPNLGDLPQFPGQQEEPERPRPTLRVPQQDTESDPNVATPELNQGQDGQDDGVIPRTGETGNLAGPVTTPPENLEELYVMASPGTVSILVEVSQGGQVGAGAGSGFVLTDSGYVVTNHHVIEGATNIVVRFFNDTDVRAEVIGDDPNSDLAVLQVESLPEGAAPLPLGDSGQIRVGDAVVAIGNPFSLGTSMSYGIISAVGRTIPSGFTPFNIPEAIQTDAAINPGNSGGPLINMNGEVIGINAQIRTAGDGGGNVGIGFAIPVNILKQIYPDLIASGSYSWPYLGVSSPAESAAPLSEGEDVAPGAYIAEVQPGGPADQAGLQQGDVVVSVDGQAIQSFDDLLTYIAYKRPGDQVNLTISRNGEQGDLTVTLGERPSELIPQQ